MIRLFFSHRVYLNDIQNNTVSFTLSTILNEQVMTLISNLNNTGPGHKGVPMFVFKENAEVLSPVIAHICNKSLSESTFPCNLFIASVLCL